MTVVGKILVFFNLVFSLVVGVFAVMDYTARTHWVEGYKTLESRYAVLQSANAAYKTEADTLAKQKEDLYERLNKSGVKMLDSANKEDQLRVADNAIALINDQARQLDRLRTEVADARKQRQDAMAQVAKYREMELAMKTNVQTNTNDAGVLRKTLKEETDKNMALTVSTNEYRDNMVQAQLQARTLKDRNTQLEGQLREMAQQVALAAKGGGGAGGARGGVNPPPDNLEGSVRQVDGRLVTLSLGSDAGLMRGQVLQVFRLGNQAKYVGEVRVVDVRANSAVGEATGRTSPIQVNDRVASRIIGGP